MSRSTRDTRYRHPSRVDLPLSGHGREGENVTPIEQTLYQYLVAPVVRDCGEHSEEAQLAYATWERIVVTLQGRGETKH